MRVHIRARAPKHKYIYISVYKYINTYILGKDVSRYIYVLYEHTGHIFIPEYKITHMYRSQYICICLYLFTYIYMAVRTHMCVLNN